MRRWLRDLRLKKGYSQEIMADKLGVSRQYYSFIESRERRKVLPLDVAEKLSAIFHISLNQISKWESEL